jgi:hypothetical protein
VGLGGSASALLRASASCGKTCATANISVFTYSCILSVAKHTGIVAVVDAVLCRCDLVVDANCFEVEKVGALGVDDAALGRMC